MFTNKQNKKYKQNVNSNKQNKNKFDFFLII